MAELLNRKIPYVWPGPDVWAPTRQRWPEVFTQPDQVHLNKAGDALDARLWHEHLKRYDRGDLKQTLESAWGPDWRRSVTNSEGLKEATTQGEDSGGKGQDPGKEETPGPRCKPSDLPLSSNPIAD